MKPIIVLPALLCLGIAAGWALDLAAGSMLLWVCIFFVLALLREVWSSEQARRLIERDRNEHLAHEREVGRAHQRDRGD